MNIKLLKQYASKKNKINELVLALHDMEAKVLEELTAYKAETAENTFKSEFGVFSLVEYKSWTYSVKTQELAERLKKAQKIEQIDGSATFELDLGLRFKK